MRSPTRSAVAPRRASLISERVRDLLEGSSRPRASSSTRRRASQAAQGSKAMLRHGIARQCRRAHTNRGPMKGTSFMTRSRLVDTNIGGARGHWFADWMCHRWLSSEWFHSMGWVRHASKACALSHGWSGCRRGCCWVCSSGCSGRRRGCCRVFGCAWSALRGPFTGRYIIGSYMFAFTVLFGSSFPCILLLRLAFRCPRMQFIDGRSQAPKRIILKPT